MTTTAAATTTSTATPSTSREQQHACSDANSRNATLVYEDEDLVRERRALLRRWVTKGYRTTPTLHVNGRKVPAALTARARPDQTLLQFLRDVLRLTGTKLGCAEGGCGACTVMISKRIGAAAAAEDEDEEQAVPAEATEKQKKIKHYAVNACLMPVLACDGCHVTTVEGIGTADDMHPVQRVMVDQHGSQCGYCTPGIVVSMYSMLSNDCTVSDVEEHLDGNLCRCTGYRPIWDACRSLCRDVEECGLLVSSSASSSASEGGGCGRRCSDCPKRGNTPPPPPSSCQRDDCNTTANKAGTTTSATADVEEEENNGGGGGGGGSSRSLCWGGAVVSKNGVDVVVSTTADKMKAGQELLSSKEYCRHRKGTRHADDRFPPSLLNEDDHGDEDLSSPLVVIGNDAAGADAAGGSVTWWFQPTTLLEMLSLLKEFNTTATTTKGGVDGGGGGSKIVVGNTEVGIETRFKGAVYPRLIHPAESIRELYRMELVHDDENSNSSWLIIGSCTPLSTIQDRCRRLVLLGGGRAGGPAENNADAAATTAMTTTRRRRRLKRTCQPVHDMLRWFASTQIRNVACLGGNLVTASPIADMNPILLALDATLVLCQLGDGEDDRENDDGGYDDNERGDGNNNNNNNNNNNIRRRSVRVSDFFLKYRTVDVRPAELLERVEIPLLQPVLEYFHVFKQARRREDDISIVCAAIRVKVKVNVVVDAAGAADERPAYRYVIDDAAVALGGMAPTTVVARRTAADGLLRKEFCEATFDDACAVLLREFPLQERVPGGQAAFRMALACSFLKKFYLTAAQELAHDVDDIRSDPERFSEWITTATTKKTTTTSEKEEGKEEEGAAVAAAPAADASDADAMMMLESLPAPPAVHDEDVSGAYNFVTEPKPSFYGTQTYPAPRSVAPASGIEGDVLPVAEGVRSREENGGNGGGDGGGKGDDDHNKQVECGDTADAFAAGAGAGAGAVASTPPASSAAAVGKPSHHLSGPLHCTGQAVYTDDIPLPPGTLQAALVLSDRAGVNFLGTDCAAALRVPGVAAVYGHDDLVALGGCNALGPIVQDETVFLPAGGRIAIVGQVLAICVGETLESAERGAAAVTVRYGGDDEQQDDDKVIVSIQDAIEAGSFYEDFRAVLRRGSGDVLDDMMQQPDTDAAATAGGGGGGGRTGDAAVPLRAGDVVKVSGTFRSGSQEHFYLETHSTLVVPTPERDLTIYCSTQATTKTQTCCAAATGLPCNRVVVKTKRMGGGFGGKETRNVFSAAAASVAAVAAGRPVRLTLPRDVDMKTTGMRHCFYSRYHASAELVENPHSSSSSSSPSSGGTNLSAKLRALHVELYSNAGSGADLSGPVVARAVFHVDGCYYWPHFRADGVPCKTAQAPHTAFRGFGGPQGMAVAEHVLEHLAVAAGLDADRLRRDNLYRDGQATPYGTIVGEQDSGEWHVPRMYDRMYRDNRVAERRAAVRKFNAENRHLKRGLSVVPTKFGIAFTAKFMNQGGCLVHVYTDGTVLVSHGGTEMGQGLHTKVCQVAAQALGVDLSDVYINDSSTDKVANTIPTAASMSTDLYGMACLDACRQILKRLEPVRAELGPAASLKQIATAAFYRRIDLSAHGFYKLNDHRCGYDFTAEKPDDWDDSQPENSWKGHPFNYFTQGVAVCEVEVDVLTGSHRTLSADVLVDVGSSINPAIDMGQIEGAFVQGMGWSCLEEVVYADDDHRWIRPRGSLFTAGPGTYKIPAFNDAPEVFNVSLLENASNPMAVHSSKAIGEPPFFLGASVFFAIKDAVSAARKENLGRSDYFEMRMPATSERIRMMTADKIAAAAVEQLAQESGDMDRTGEGDKIRSFQPQGSY